MTSRFVSLSALSLFAVSLNACALASGGKMYAQGTLFRDYEAPGALGSGELGTRTGKACAASILGAFALGESSISKAAQDGGITKVSHVDHKNLSVLRVYAKTCTIVHGT